ncbi:MAG: hypothetical protein NTZ38_00850 [Candidatus Taylorbacteria bacterium]|nr:hypothetical protein [Candidatus Taylorbacteria bacterium]
MSELLAPKFLTKVLAQKAVQMVLESVMFSSSGAPLKRKACYIVVLVPGMDMSAGENAWPNFPCKPVALYEHKVRQEDWSDDYKTIAQCKALQRWHDRSDGGTDVSPHLLYTGDTPFWGAVKRQGIVVSCSGIQPYFDRMIAGMIADAIIGFAYHAWAISQDKTDGVLFLT